MLREKNRQVIGASWSVLIFCLNSDKLIYDKYPNKDKCYEFCGLVINQRDMIRVTRREQLYIFIKHKDFVDHDLHCIQKWVRLIICGIETYAFKYSKYNEGGGG